MALLHAARRARSWLFDLFAHHHAERLRTERAIVRKASGVDVEDFPYPGAVVGSGNPTTIHQSGKGWLPGVLLGAAMLAAGGAGTLGLVKLLGPAAVVPAPPAASLPEKPVVSLPAPAAPLPGKDPAFDQIQEVQQPDGSWSLVPGSRVRLVKRPDGSYALPK